MGAESALSANVETYDCNSNSMRASTCPLGLMPVMMIRAAPMPATSPTHSPIKPADAVRASTSIRQIDSRSCLATTSLLRASFSAWLLKPTTNEAKRILSLEPDGYFRLRTTTSRAAPALT